MNSIPSLRKNLTDYYQGKWKIQQLAELTAVQDMQTKAAENQRNNAAESAAVRRAAWGETSDPQTSGEEMATTVLGDITNPTPIVVNQQQSNLLPIALAAMAAVGVPGLLGAGALAGYLLNNTTQKDTSGFEDESVKIGLGRIEDYIQRTP